jgi:uncharacterized membrane protein HdeD (DUF308 family)
MSYRLFSSDQGHRTLIAWVLLIVGLVLTFYANSFLTMTVRLAAILLLIYSVIELVYTLKRPQSAAESAFLAAIGAVLGIVLLIWPKLLVNVFPIAAGIVLLVCAVYQIWKSFTLKSLQVSGWLGSLIVGICILAGAVYLLFNPFSAASLIFRIAGILLVLEGCMILWQQAQFD